MRRAAIAFLCGLASLAAFAAAPLSDSERPLAPAPIIADGLTELGAAGSPYGFLLAWYENGSLRAARLSQDGEVIDRDPIIIPSTYFGTPVVEWNGSDYVVGWPFQPFYPDPARKRVWNVSPEGVVRGPFDRPVQRNGRGESLAVETEVFGRWATFIAIAENGARRSLATVNTLNTLIPYMIVPVGDGWGVLATEIGRARWFTLNPDGTYYSNVFGQSVSFRSIVRHENEIAYSWANFQTGVPDVGYNVVDIRTGGYRTEVLRPSSPGTNSSTPVLAYSGSELIAAWVDAEPRAGGRNTLYVKSRGVTRTIATYDSMQSVMPVLASGARNLIAWGVSNFPPVFSQTFARTFVDAGELEDGRAPQTLREGPATQLAPRAAASSNGFFAAWSEQAPTPRIVGRFYPAAGAPSEPVAVSEPGQFRSHDVAFGNGTYLVAWSELDYGFTYTGGLGIAELRIQMRRYDATGAPLDAAPVTIVRIEASPYLSTGVAAINDGTTFVIAWLGDGGKLHATRVRSTGPDMISPVLRLSEDPIVAGPRLVRVGDSIVALYEVEPFGAAKRIEAARIRPDLRVESRETLWEIKSLQSNGVGQYYDYNPFAAAANGDELLLAWSEKAGQQSNGNHCLYSRRYTSSFVPIEPAREIACHEPYEPYQYENDLKRYAPAAAWDGKRWWITASGNIGNVTMNAWRLAADGSAEPPMTMAAAEHQALNGTLIPAPYGLIALYSRLFDARALYSGIRRDFTRGAFYRPIATNPRRRSAGH